MAKHFDVLIRGADVIDGTGAARFTADVAVIGDRIIEIGDLTDSSAEIEIDATGHVVAPGFIDAHTHDDRLLLSGGDMSPKISQGITTIIGGNCGISLAPMPGGHLAEVPAPLNLLDGTGEWFKFKSFASYMKALAAAPAATNCAMLVGHSTLRVATMADLSRPANFEETTAMRDLVVEAMEAGAIGISTGLAYPPAFNSSTQEVIDICEPLSKYNGLYCTHLRDEGNAIIESLEEAFRIGREINVPVVLSHHKVTGLQNYGRSEETLDVIKKNMENQPICLDCYPYAAASTVLVHRIASTSSKVTVTWSKGLPEYAGMDLDEIMKKLDVGMEEAIERLLPAGAIYYRMDEADVQKILEFEDTMIGSDGLPHDQIPHPRLWGCFTRVLGHYGRGLGLFPLEKAIHKMTGLTARNFGLADRGVVKAGAFADLTIFDETTVDARATFADPIAPSFGIAQVLVNGDIVWANGESTGTRPGRVLSRAAA
ncbi:N-acyl-D-amino-acid deacylase family protein [Achromobacter xylosoxidans]|uniref:N-acyl-D-amino-acid deacylase family protein n=1 Tax=Alcaligenes xylosoxydans xylosoxydans TaxID=85698 RepID=UPI001F146D2E|nr:D-aminoacylase [Achromobacter xylosoxidans]